MKLATCVGFRAIVNCLKDRTNIAAATFWSTAFPYLSANRGLRICIRVANKCSHASFPVD